MWERRLEAEGAPEGLAFFLFFGESRFSSDNAVGVAALGYDREVAK